MSAFKENVFSGSRTIFWGVVPLGLLMVVWMNVAIFSEPPAAREGSAHGRIVLVVFDLAVVLLAIGLYNPIRFRWSLRALSALIFLSYTSYWISALRAGNGLLEPTLGLIVIGVPSFIYALKGRFRWREPLEDYEWVELIRNSKDASVLREAFGAVVDANGAPDIAKSLKAFIAAEVVAAMRDGVVDPLPPGLEEWPLKYRNLLTPELLLLANQAVARIGSVSELKEAWENQGDGNVFGEKVRDLRQRLV